MTKQAQCEVLKKLIGRRENDNVPFETFRREGDEHPRSRWAANR